jgi:indolepyruvate ferredoxin oxidoreductase beta subunit
VDILLSGVGGQGIILASDILCEVAMTEGYDVKKSDSLGMSQRGGSVVSHVRLGEEVFAPLIGRDSADILLAFERLEGARNVSFLKPGGIAIVNDYAIPPLMVSAGRQQYPEDDTIRDILLERTDRNFSVTAQATAMEMKNPRVTNLVMLGFLSAFLPIKEHVWKEHIPKKVPPRFVELNLEAFARGRAEAGTEGRPNGN